MSIQRKFQRMMKSRRWVHFISYVGIPIIVTLVGYSLFQIFGGIVSDFSLWTEQMNFETNGSFPYLPETLIYFFIIAMGAVFLAAYYRTVRRLR